jgi:hypothetical protein
MHSGRAQKSGFAAEHRTIIAGSATTGVCASPSDSIGIDFNVPPIPNGEGQRQTKRAGLRGTKIPCLPTPYNPQYIPFWNQPVAVESEVRLRQPRIIYTSPEEARTKMATLSHFWASLLYGVISEFLQTQHAVSMANPEV